MRFVLFTNEYFSVVLIHFSGMLFISLLFQMFIIFFIFQGVVFCYHICLSFFSNYFSVLSLLQTHVSVSLLTKMGSSSNITSDIFRVIKKCVTYYLPEPLMSFIYMIEPNLNSQCTTFLNLY